MKTQPFLRWFGILLIAALLIPNHTALAAQPALPQPAGSVPRFEPGPCTFKPVLGLTEGSDLSCGKLIVPELYANPDGPTIALEVAIIKSTSANPRPDPVVFAQGGPGGSTIDTYTQMLPNSRIRRNRDLILFDQRGTLYAEPNLACLELYDDTIASLALNLSTAESEQRQYVAAMACHSRLLKEGVNLAAFNSVENANDIESLRTALGFNQINLYGVSYGTLLALHAMRQNPAGLRSVIIDSVVPPNVNFNFEAPRSQNRAFTELFKACAEDAACAADYPNLESFFFDLVERLNQKPVTITLTESETGKSYPTLINGDALIGILFQMLYSSEFLPLLPKMIRNMANGHYAFLETVLPLFIFDKSVSYGMYFSVVCAEGGTSDPSQISFSDIRPQLAKDADVSNQALVKLCTAWEVPPIAASEDDPVISDIPTLVFNGRFDPITPPAYGALAAKTLANSYSFTFPNTGHGALMTSDCADAIFLEFLSNPANQPDSSCIASLPAVKFVTSADVVDVPAAAQLMIGLNDLLGKGKIPAGVIPLSLLLLGMLSSVGVFPLLWLVRVVRRKPARETPGLTALAHLASWLPALTAGVLVLFLGAFLTILFMAAINGDNSYFFGIPARSQAILILPLFALLLWLLSAAFTAAGWVGRYWSLGRKIYHTLLTLCGLGAFVMLAMGGLLTALFG